MPARKLPKLGAVFGEWTFLGEFDGPKWKCQCSCGKVLWPCATHLRQGVSKSCHGKAHPTHGRSKSKLYTTWAQLKQRCSNPKAEGYHLYGGRGIKLHGPWVTNFTAFALELGEPPSPEHTVERIKNDQGYVPGNIRWATPFEQSRNRRSNHWITIDGIEACITDWCAFTGVNVSTAVNRIKLYGYTPEEAVGLKHKS